MAIAILNTITAQQDALKRADPLDVVECEGCGFKKRYAVAVHPGPDDGPATMCSLCSMHPTCGAWCGEEITEEQNPLGVCSHCVGLIRHEDCKEHPCADCYSNQIDAAEALEVR